MMRMLLTSCGLETPAITGAFLRMLPAAPDEARVLFIPVAAIDPDAIEVLPKCLSDMLNIGVPRDHITVYDLHDPIDGPLAKRWHAVYLCGGDTRYLLRRINEHGFRKQLLDFISSDGAVLGVSAGSIIFATNLPNNLGLLSCPLDVHCPDSACDRPGPVGHERDRIRLGNRQALLWTDQTPCVIE